jgi:phosphoglycolate phosphatase
VPLLIFDLDGTLIDSKLDLAHAVNATRGHMGKGPISHDLIYSYVGNGAPVLIRRAMRMSGGPEASEDEVETALEFFIEYYREHAVDYTVLYPGVRESLDRLHDAGMTLALLTNKPVNITRSMMDHFGLSDKMFRMYGGNSFEHKKPHPVGIHTLRAEAGAEAEDTWMIGDSGVDIQTARNAGVLCCGVTYGFQPESFQDYPPDLQVDRLEDFAGRFLP